MYKLADPRPLFWALTARFFFRLDLQILLFFTEFFCLYITKYVCLSLLNSIAYYPLLKQFAGSLPKTPTAIQTRLETLALYNISIDL